MKSSTKTILISGATQGVGYELAKICARRNFHIGIVGNDCSTLHNISEILRALGSPAVHVICKDLSSENAATEIFEESIRLCQRVDILINNLATPPLQRFSGDLSSRQAAIVRQNVLGMVKMTGLFLKLMKGQGGGIISQVLSRNSEQRPDAAEEAAESFTLTYTRALMRDPANVRVRLLIHQPVTPEPEISAREILTEIVSGLPARVIQRPAIQETTQSLSR